MIDAAQVNLSPSKPAKPIEAVLQALHVLYRQGDVVELRTGLGQRVIAGYFDDFTKLAENAIRLNNHSVYVTLNECDQRLLARMENRTDRAANQTKDHEIIRRRWLLIDLDGDRPTGISATDDEVAAAKQRGREIFTYLQSLGWPDPVVACSGNGLHLLYRIDIPIPKWKDNGNKDVTLPLINRCLQALDVRYSDDAIKVDTSVGNASQIVKLYGTVASKGDNTKLRPHRTAELIQVPDAQQVVSVAQLEALAATLPAEPESNRKASSYQTGNFDVDAYLAEHNVPVLYSAPYNQGHKWVLEKCVWNPEHNDKSAVVIQFGNGSGGLSASCRHNSCQGLKWQDFRDAVDPGWRDRRVSTCHESSENQTHVLTADNADSVSIPPWKPFPSDALPEWLAKYTVDVASEMGCDPVYVIFPTLATLAAAIGSTRRLTLKPMWHVPAILWAVSVGRSGTKKSPPAYAVTRYIRALDSRLRVNEKANKKENRKGRNRLPTRAVCSDTTIETLKALLQSNPRGLLLFRDELTAWLGSFDRYSKGGKGSADLGDWLTLYNGELSPTDRKYDKTHIKSLDVAVSITGTIQPGVLRQSLHQVYWDSGLVARLLMAFPPEKKRSWTDYESDIDNAKQIDATIEQLFRMQHNDRGEACRVTMSSEAKTCYVDYYNVNCGDMFEESDDRLVAGFSKLEETAARIALVLHCAEWAHQQAHSFGAEIDPFRLDLPAMVAGTTIGDWAKDETRRVYLLMKQCDQEREDEKLKEWIRDRGSVTVRDLKTYNRAFRDTPSDKIETQLARFCDRFTEGRKTVFKLKC